MKNYFYIFCLLCPTFIFAQTFKSVERNDATQIVLPEKLQDIRKPLPHTTKLKRDEMVSHALPMVVYTHKDGRPSVIQYQNNKKIQGRSQQVRIFDYLSDLKSVLPIDAPKEQFVVIAENQDDLGQSHIKLQQTVNGIPVYGKELVLHEKNGRFQMANGDVVKIKNNHTTPKIAKETVLANLEDYVSTKVNYETTFNREAPSAELVVFPTADSSYLTWKVRYQENVLHTWEVFIDAIDGTVRNKYLLTCSLHHYHFDHVKEHTSEKENKTEFWNDQNGNGIDLFGNNQNFKVKESNGVYYMIDATRSMFNPSLSNIPNDPVGVIWTIDAVNTDPTSDNGTLQHVASTNNRWSDPASVSGHVNAGIVYDYYLNVHNRNSINGRGGNVVSVVNVADEGGGGLDNAYWNGSMMFYGNGRVAFEPLAKALDVAAHEISHGVIQNTANLNYQGESGAINESFADVFGVLVDNDDWMIGEEVAKPAYFPSGALRNMQDPNNGGTRLGDPGYQPKNTSEQYFGEENNGGVHINSGIPNRAFYLFAREVGREKAGRVYYRALTTYLTRSSDFKALRFAIEQSTIDLYGEGQELTHAKNAFDIVGIQGSGNIIEDEIDSNDGKQYMAFTTSNRQDVLIADFSTNQAYRIYQGPIRSRISVTDDGSLLVWVNEAGEPYFAQVQYDPFEVNTGVLVQNNTNFDRAVISKDGNRVAFILKDVVPEIIVYDFDLQQFKNFELYNPTFTQGIQTGDVKYPDAMEFDYSGEYILYDAFNELQSNFGENIDYWDAGFLHVFDNNTGQFANGEIVKLFTGLPARHSLGNATYANTNRNIIAFDYSEGDGNFQVALSNFETGRVSDYLVVNGDINYPSFDRNDSRIAVESTNNSTSFDIYQIPISISNFSTAGDLSVLISDARWGTFFANGTRDLSTSNELVETYAGKLTITPTLAQNQVDVSLTAKKQLENVTLLIYDYQGKQVYQSTHINVGKTLNQSIAVGNLANGSYILTVQHKTGLISQKFVKM